MKKLVLFLSVILLLGTLVAQNRDSMEFEQQQDDKLLEMAREMRLRMEAEKAEAIQMALQKGWVIQAEVEGGGYMELMRLDASGMPEYYITGNLNAARTSETDHLWPGGVTGLNLTGQGMLIGEWDGGGVLTTHQEYNDGSGTRVTQRDSPGSLHYHSTHVAGTLIAEGQVNAAHGMAPEAHLDAYDWNSDNAEMITAAANDDLIISNHSYGQVRGWAYSDPNWYWYGNPTISASEDYLFGFYNDASHDLDQIALNAPHYLMCYCAMNDRNDNHAGQHYYFNGSDWVTSNTWREQDGGSDGYDCLVNNVVAKNPMAVGAVADIPAGYSSPADVVLESYSNCGPTDDGRIKPDIVANGQNLYSTWHTGNSNYDWLSGTSMATPTVTGTLTLIQEYYEDEHGGFMNAPVAKALAINTAHEAGTADGPDYRFGWGLLNATGMADMVTRDANEGGLIVETILTEDQISYYTYYCDGSSDINVTICWNDPPHDALTPALNPSTRVLVNDLNIRIYNESKATYYPWKLDGTNPADAAYKGSNYKDNVETVNIKNPASGFYTVRINESGTLQGGEQSYALIINGMTTPADENYCQTRHTSWQSFEYISKIICGDINNTSGRSPGGFGDFTGLASEFNIGETQSLQVTINGYSGDQVVAWVDWNQNGVFTDANETYVVGSGAGPFTKSITAPGTAKAGFTTMRVALAYNTTPSPCGNFSYGETEDYAIRVVVDENVWTGAFNHYWHNDRNWSLGRIPTFTDDVVITSAGYTPSVDIYDETCHDLTIQSGAQLTIADQMLTVYGEFTCHGQLIMNDNDSELKVYSNVSWESGSTANFSNSNLIRMYGDLWFFKSGSNVQMNSGTVMFAGSNDAYIRNYSALSQFYTLGSYKSAGFELGVSAYSSQPLKVKNSLYVHPDAKFGYYSLYNLFLLGSLNSNGTFICNYGKVMLDGTSQTLRLNDGDYFNDLTFSQTGTVSVITTLSDTVDINGDLTIESGVFSPGASTVKVGGNWQDNVAPGGFEETGSRVIFNGSGHQYIYGDENFNILEVDNGAALRLNNVNYDVTCNSYDWTAGGIDIIAGNFTALNLEDDGLYGGFWVNPNGTINLTNDNWVDLNGEIHNYGGTFNVSGSISEWPYSADAVVEMTAGVIDFKTCGITIVDNDWDFTANITGGTIRTAYSFVNQRADIDLSQLSIEMYGSFDAILDLVEGVSIGWLEINKEELDDLPTLKQCNRDGKPLSNLKLANNVNLMSNIEVAHDANILAGSLTLNGYEATIKENFNVYGSLMMDEISDLLNVGTYNYQNLSFYEGSQTNLSNGEVHLASWIVVHPGADFSADTANTIYFDGSLASSNGIHMEEPGTSFGNIEFVDDYGGYFFFAPFESDIVIDGDFTLHPNVYFQTQSADVFVNGQFFDSPTSEMYIGFDLETNPQKQLMSSEGINQEKVENSRSYSAEFNADFTQNGLIDVGSGSLTVHGRYAMESTGSMIIHGGTFIADSPDHASKGWEYIHGNLQMSDGLFEITHNSINFTSTANTSVSGGILRSGGAFRATDPGVFEPTGGTVEIIGNTMDGAIYCGNGNYFYNLLINKDPANYSQFMGSNGVTILNDFTIESGILNTGSCVMFVGGNWANYVGLDGFVENENIVWLYGETYSHILTDETFYDLYIFDMLTDAPGNGGRFVDETYIDEDVTVNVSNNCSILGGSLNLANNSTLDIQNNLSISSGAEMIVPGTTFAEIFLGGNFNDYNATPGFTPGYSTFTFDGVVNQDLNAATYLSNFYNLIIDNAQEKVTIGIGLQIFGDLQILDGAFLDGSSESFHYFHGDVTVEPEGALLPYRIVSFVGSSNAVFTNNTSGSSYFQNDVFIDKNSPVAGLTLESRMLLLNSASLIVNEGFLDLNTNLLRSTENVTINDGGTLTIDEGAELEVGENDQLTVESGGILEVMGEPGNPATLSAWNAPGKFNFAVASGGTIRADYGIFEHTAGFNGVYVMDGGIIDPVYCFNNCEFRYGSGETNSALLVINNDQELTIENASFPGATTSFNVAKDLNKGHLTFVDYSGAFAGEDYDYDNYNLIDWYTPVLSVSPMVRNVSAPAGSTTFAITSNLDWTASESTAWFSVSPPAGTGNGTLTVNYLQNTALIARSGQITFSADDVPDVVVTVNQAGANAILTVSPANRSVDPAPGATTFAITSNTSWTVSESVAWFNVSPMSGSGNKTLNVSYGENSTGSTRVGSITVTATGGAPSQTVTVTQSSYPTQLIALPEGWSGLSGYIMPANNDIEDVFDPISGNFEIASTMTGIYYPAGPVNTIYDWESQSAYKVKMSTAASLPLIGNPETNKTLSLNSGWSLVPVICNIPVDAQTLFVGTDFEIVKDVAGLGILWPEYGINTLGNFVPGKAYYALMNMAGSIIFPANAKNAESFPAQAVELPANPWTNKISGPATHVVAMLSSGFSGVMTGDVIALFGENGKCYGISKIRSLSENAVIAAYADDPYTHSQDGFASNENMNLKLFRPQSNEVLDITTTYDLKQPNTHYFQNEGVSVITALKVSALGINDASTANISLYPNPTNGLVELSGINDFTKIEIYNANGKLMRTIAIENQDEYKMDLSDLPGGVYQLKFTGNATVAVKKLIRK